MRVFWQSVVRSPVMPLMVKALDIETHFVIDSLMPRPLDTQEAAAPSGKIHQTKIDWDGTDAPKPSIERPKTEISGISQMPKLRRAIYYVSSAAFVLISLTLLVLLPIDLGHFLSLYFVHPSSPLFAFFVIISALMVLYLLLRGLATQVFAFLEARPLWDDRLPSPTHFPRVSILVPAFKESETIEAALLSLSRLNYSDFEVLVIDDGSPDDTYAKANSFAVRHPQMRLRVYKKPNGGKWSALNLAFLCSSADLILCVDADSRLDPDALLWLVDRMERSGADVVSGQVSVRNRDQALTQMQAAEYVIANASLRMAQSLFGKVLVVPGPIGLYRRAALETVLGDMEQREWTSGAGACFGPLSSRTFAEDFHLSLVVLAAGHKIVFEPRALARTQAPATMWGLINQRYRWSRGTIQVIRLYFTEMRGRHKCFGSILDFWILLGIVPDLLLFPLLNMGIILALPWILMGLSDREGFLLHLALTAGWSAASLLSALAMQNDQWRLMIWFPLLSFYQAGVLNFTMLVSCLDEARGTKMRWS